MMYMTYLSEPNVLDGGDKEVAEGDQTQVSNQDLERWHKSLK